MRLPVPRNNGADDITTERFLDLSAGPTSLAGSRRFAEPTKRSSRASVSVFLRRYPFKARPISLKIKLLSEFNKERKSLTE
jgi:hypothetical protein